MDLQIFVIILQVVIPALTGKEQGGIEYQEVLDPSCLNNPLSPFTVEPINLVG